MDTHCQKNHPKQQHPIGDALTWPEVLVALVYAACLVGAVLCLMGR